MKTKYPPVLKGQRYGHWIVVTDPFRGTYGTVVVCECDCNRQKIVHTNYLKLGKSTSCGCARPGLVSIRKLIHGRSKYRDPIYIKWKGMRQRCKDPSFSSYSKYGGKGIKVCDEWQKSFLAFEKWALENGYKEGLHIDRIDPNRDYEPSNCRFATPFENARNKPLNRTNTSGYKGVSFNKRLKKWSASITANHHQHHLGYFTTKEEAANAYDAVAPKYHGIYANLNFPSIYEKS